MGSCVAVVSVSQKFMGHKFLCCHNSEKEHEKGAGAYFALTPDSFGRTFPLARLIHLIFEFKI